MNMSFKRITMLLVLILCLVLVFGGIYMYINYKVINGHLVNVNEVAYLDYEQSMQQSYDSGDVEAQVEYAQKLQTVAGNSTGANLALAQALLNKGSLRFEENINADQAISLLQNVLEKEPNNVEALSAMGYAYEIKQEYDKSFEFYNRALSINPEDEGTLVRRGHAYELSGKTEEAQDDYLKAYSINPDSDFTLLHIARMSYSIQDYPKAIEFADLILDKSQNAYTKAVASEIIGQIAIIDDDYATAQQYFDYSISLDDTYPGPYLQYAYVNIIKSDKATSTKAQLLADATEDVDYALSLHPQSAFALVLKGLISDQQKDSKSAKEYYKKALAMVDYDITLGAKEKESTRKEINQLLK
jgi:tetratricopeptide (TPR) repeat protein